jgi:hypothetical protein
MVEFISDGAAQDYGSRLAARGSRLALRQKQRLQRSQALNRADKGSQIKSQIGFKLLN